jgi:hypothetical protein
MEKLFGLALLICGLFFVPAFGLGIPMVIFGVRYLTKDDSSKS